MENTVGLVKGKIRTIRLSLQTRYNYVIKGDHNVVPWMIREAAEYVNRFQVGEDGKTRYERLKGKKFRREIAEFGECIYYLGLKTKGVNNYIL